MGPGEGRDSLRCSWTGKRRRIDGDDELAGAGRRNRRPSTTTWVGEEEPDKTRFGEARDRMSRHAAMMRAPDRRNGDAMLARHLR